MSSPLESDVGITEFVSTLPGFTGILKHRFRDFQVKEIDLRGQVARLTSLEPFPQTDGGSGSPAAPQAAERDDGPFDPARLHASRPQLVASFTALAGAENGVVLDNFLRRVAQMYGIQEGQAKGAEEDLAGSADCGNAGDSGAAAGSSGEPGAGGAAGEAATQGVAVKKDTDADPDASMTAGAAIVEAAGGAAADPATTEKGPEAATGGSAAAADGDASAAPGPNVGSGPAGASADTKKPTGCGAGDAVPVRISVLLRPIASKDVRKAVHEFFRATRGLPPVKTETTTAPADKQPQQAEAEASCPTGRVKREATDSVEDERPAKWQRGGGRGGGRARGGDGGGRDGRGRGREGRGGRGGGSGRGGGDSAQLQQQQQQPPPQTVIEVIFDPKFLQATGRDGRDGPGRGGPGGRGGGRGRDHSGSGGGGGGGRDRRGRRGGGGEWEGGPHNFVRFVLYKENMDTQVALNVVARMLGIMGGKCFGFAGTKDKRGITCQFVTAYRVSPARLAGINHRLRGIRLGDFSFGDEGLKLGLLGGNEFHLVMRDVRLEGPEAGSEGADGDAVAQMAAACEAVARNGFINYFGLQRFGTGGAPTHEVGRALLRGEYDKAVRLVLTGRPDERPDISAARRLFFEKGDAKGALRGIPTFMLGERAVLGALVRHGASAWSAAMLAVPRTLRMMYLHAWQSYVWNSAVSHRVRTYGNDRVVEGDLVLPRTAAAAGGAAAAAAAGEAALLLDADGAGEAVEEQGLLEGGELAEDGAEAADGGEGSAAASTAARRLAMVRVVTAADVAAARYSVFDVVLPLPGTEVQYPEHATGEWIRKVAAEAGVDLSKPVSASAANRELSFASLTGDYRHILHKPKDFHFAFKRYSDPNDDTLLLTDLELLQRKAEPLPPPPPLPQQQAQQGHPAAGGDPGSGGEQPQPPAEPQVKNGAARVIGSGPLLALELRFQLPSSCYATMLLRDLTKSSTSKFFHAGLSAASAPAVASPGGPASGAAAAEAAAAGGAEAAAAGGAEAAAAGAVAAAANAEAPAGGDEGEAATGAGPTAMEADEDAREAVPGAAGAPPGAAEGGATERGTETATGTATAMEEDASGGA